MNDHSRLIVFDGVEGCGKSTQAKLLADAFSASGYHVVDTKQPGGSTLGEKLRYELLHSPFDYNSGQQALIFSTDRLLHQVQLITDWLGSGYTVICDRWASSTWAYQGFADGVGTDVIELLTKLAIGDFHPDLLFILDIEPEFGFKRKCGDKFDKIECRPIEYHRQVRQGFLDFATKHRKFCRIVNAGIPAGILHRNLVGYINQHFDLSLTAQEY